MKKNILLSLSLIPLLSTGLLTKKESNIMNNNIMKFKNDFTITSNASNSEFKANNANDQDYSTYWEGDGLTNQSLILDLKEIKKVNSVVQIFKDEDIWLFKILGSIDGVNYFEILDNSKGEFGATFQESCSFYARYLKLDVIKSLKGFIPTSKEFYCTYEDLEVGENLLLNLKGDAHSRLANYEPNKAFDNDSGTYWCASDNSYPQWISAEVSKISKINKVEVQFLDYGKYEFEVEGRDENNNRIKIVERNTFIGSTFKFDTNVNVDALVFRIFSGPGYANLVEFKAYGFKEIDKSIIENITQFESLTYIDSITSNEEISYSFDGINFIKFDNELSNFNQVVKAIKCSEDTKLYGYSLSKNLVENLKGTCSDYSDHDHILDNITKENSTLEWKTSTLGKEEFFEFDLGRISKVDKINLEFLKSKNHKFIIETSIDKSKYEIYADYSNNNADSTKFDLINNDIKDVRYIRCKILPSKDEVASLYKFRVFGNGNPNKENWREDNSGVLRFYPKLQKVTLNEITRNLDNYRYQGFKVIELHQPYEGLADIWAGLGGTNNYKVDPLIGTLDDLENLINEAHKRGMYVFMFGNVGYGKSSADYFKKACKDYALGINSKERNWFVFSDECVDPTKWFYSDIANAYYYGYWGENGQIPTFNFENEDWQKEAFNYIDFWSDFGIDGIALDAPDVYYFGNAVASDVTYKTITKTLIKKNLFALPEGSGDNKFIASYHYKCVQNYGMSSWGGNAYSLGLENYLNSNVGDSDNVIKNNRDTTVALGGVSMATMNFEDNYLHLSEKERVLEAALVTSTGHLSFLHSGSDARIGQDIIETWDKNIQKDIYSLFGQQNSLKALNQSGHRYKLPNNKEDKVYSYLKMDRSGNSIVLPIFNYSNANNKNLQINLKNTNVFFKDGVYELYDSFNKESIKVKITNNILELEIANKSYKCLILR